MQNFRFLVTGGAGFIGSELVRQLAPPPREAQVDCVIRKELKVLSPEG